MPDPTMTMERRKHARTPLDMSVSCLRLDPDGEDLIDRLHLLDVSRGGLGATCGRAFYPGQRALVHLPLTPETGRRTAYATIVRCQQCDDGYRLGLEFDGSSMGSYSNDGLASAAA